MNLQKLKDSIALENHLRYNFYPPISVSLIQPFCEKAIVAVNEGDPNKMIAGVTALSLIENFHLEFFITNGE